VLAAGLAACAWMGMGLGTPHRRRRGRAEVGGEEEVAGAAMSTWSGAVNAGRRPAAIIVIVIASLDASPRGPRPHRLQ
jgi:hypothetical protein